MTQTKRSTFLGLNSVHALVDEPFAALRRDCVRRDRLAAVLVP
jgi:hypothetical protein